MITAIFSRRGERLRLTLEGHAGYASAGADIVCAAVSGIFYALCGYLLNFREKGLIIHAAVPGCGDLECGEDGEEAMRMAYIGLLQIALGYPEALAVLDFSFGTPVGRAADSILEKE